MLGLVVWGYLFFFFFGARGEVGVGVYLRCLCLFFVFWFGVRLERWIGWGNGWIDGIGDAWTPWDGGKEFSVGSQRDGH